jgi:hypothetical protein
MLDGKNNKNSAVFFEQLIVAFALLWNLLMHVVCVSDSYIWTLVGLEMFIAQLMQAIYNSYYS